MADYVPVCGICKTRAPVVGASEGFNQYEFWYLCPLCVQRIVDSATHWKVRRSRAVSARVEALQERFDTLAISDIGPRRVELRGEVAKRAVWLTLKIASREFEGERYIFRVQLHAPVDRLKRQAFRLSDKLSALLSPDSPKVTRTEHRWLRIAFLHLGKLDALEALESALAEADRLDPLAL